MIGQALGELIGQALGAYLYGLMLAPSSTGAAEAERLRHCPVAQIVLAMPSNKWVCLTQDGAK